jgi:glutamate/tyrosine decarboxylase-like PLP-dependent enzyme
MVLGAMDPAFDPAALDLTVAHAKRFLAGLAERRVGPSASFEALVLALGGHRPPPDEPESAAAVVERLARAFEPGLVASAGPRYFGFVIGGSLPAAVLLDWLTSTWDQNAQACASSPAAAAAESVAATWILELLDLPRGSSVGFVTGAQMANTTCLAAARHALLSAAGWDLAEAGLAGAPPIAVLVGAEAHVTIHAALRTLGFGRRSITPVAADPQGRMRVDALARALDAAEGPVLVAAQAGNVNSGAIDPIAEIADLVRARANAWLHVDGAFGLWARACPRLAVPLRGLERADSWTVDAHKWLNVPYDSGLAIVAHPTAHLAATAARCDYVPPSSGGERDGMLWVPENSRRARGFALLAALSTLGRRGLAEMIERNCAQARRLAELLGRDPRARVLNEIVLNQVLVAFERPAALLGGEAEDRFHERLARTIQDQGTCWLGTTRWQGRSALRISISCWSTEDRDIERTADAILGALDLLE